MRILEYCIFKFVFYKCQLLRDHFVNLADSTVSEGGMITAIPGARPIEGMDPANPAVYKKVLWRLMPLLILCYISAFLNRQNVGFAKLQFMHDLKFTEAIYGVGGGIFYLGYVLFEIPSNLYLAKSGARKTLLRIM